MHFQEPSFFLYIQFFETYAIDHLPKISSKQSVTKTKVTVMKPEVTLLQK
jgi:hypothetical protein